jgi:hypothetical protein
VEVTSQGYAARLQSTLAGTTFGVDASHASVDYIDIQGLVDSDKTLDKTSVGGFVDIDVWKNVIGLGYHHTRQENVQGEANRQDQLFLSYLFRLPIEGVAVKAVYGYARAHIEDIDTGSEWENSLHSVRLRVSYEFE